jgi:hypothetical protein
MLQQSMRKNSVVGDAAEILWETVPDGWGSTAETSTSCRSDGLRWADFDFVVTTKIPLWFVSRDTFCNVAGGTTVDG